MNSLEGDKIRFRQIDVFSLLKIGIHKFKTILIVSVAVGIVFCGLNIYNDYSAYAIQLEKNSTIKSDQLLENIGVSDNNNQFGDILVEEINRLSEIKSETIQYIDQSLLLKIDPFNFYRGELLYSISNNSAMSLGSEYILENDGILKDLLRGLHIYANILIDYDEILDYFNINKDIYLSELVTSVLTDNQLRIYVFCDTKENAYLLANYVRNKVEKKFISLCEENEVEGYTLKEINYAIGIAKDESLADYHKEKTSLLSSIDSTIESLKKLQKSIQSENHIISNQTDDSIIPSWINSKSIIKNFVYGSLLGFLISYFIIMTVLVLKEYVLSPDEFDAQYNLRRLGEFKNGSEDNVLINQSCKLINSTLNLFEPAKHKYVVISDQELTTYDKIILQTLNDNTYNTSFLLSDNILRNLDEQSYLTNCDGYILLTKVMASKYNSFNEIVSFLKNTSKPIIGSIVIE